MANTTIQKSGSAAIILHGDGKATIDGAPARKTGNLMDMPLYGFNSDQTPVFDGGGVTKKFTLSGVYVDTSVANVKTWVDSLEALLNGLQDLGNGYPLIFTDDLRGTVYVKIDNFESEPVPGAPYMVLWNMTLVQSSTMA